MQSSYSKIERAYAVLELPPGASKPRVKRQYKRLVRRWHPDRFTGDADGVAEATTRLRAINEAYKLLAEQLDVSENRQSIVSSSLSETGNTAAVDEIVNAINRSHSIIIDPMADPWNRLPALILALAHFTLSLWLTRDNQDVMKSNGSAVVGLLSVAFSVRFLSWIWSDNRPVKIFGWMCFIGFMFVFPGVVALLLKYG